MKKKLFPVTTAALLAFVSAAVTGCPVYDDEDGCYDDYDCSAGYYCDYPSGACLRDGDSAASCDQPSDCAANETCSKARICAEGDCHFASVGCVSGFECSGESGRWECVREGSSSGGGGESNGGGGGEPGVGGNPAGGAPTVTDGGAGAAAAGAPAGGAPTELSPSAGAGGN